MSGLNGEGVPSIANDAVAQHGPILFSVLVYADGTVKWTGPKSGDPMTDEILMRGWIDKARDVILAASASRSRLAI